MGGEEAKNADSTIDSVRRKLLKIGIYSVPTIIFLGKVSEARASGVITDDGKDNHEHRHNGWHWWHWWKS